MQPGPITSQSLPPEFATEFRVITVDFHTKKEIEAVYQGSSEERASTAFIETVKHIERARSEGEEWEPIAIKFFENGEIKQELLIA